MNTKKILATAFLASILFVSCKKELQPQESSEVSVTDTTVSPENNQIEKQFEVQNLNQEPQAVPSQNSAQTPVAKTPPGMNPPHGQEGHRCEIAVGAPLPK